MISGLSQQMSFRLKLGIGILFILIGFKYILLPMIQWQEDTVNNVISLQQSLERKKFFVGIEDQVEKTFNDAVDIRAQWLRYFENDLSGSQKWQLKLQKKMEELNKQLNITTANVDWLPLVNGDIIKAPVKFRLETTPEKLMKLLYAIENAPHFIAIEGIRISTRGRSDTFIAELDVSAYGLSEAMSTQ